MTSNVPYSNTLNYITSPYIEEYFDLILSGEIEACEEQFQLIELLKNHVLNRSDLYIDHEKVEDSIEIPKRYFPYELFPWQKFCNVFIFGLRYKDTKELFYTRYLLYMGRGSGKNGYFSYISFYMLSKKHGVNDYEIDLVATEEKQAKRSFTDVHNVLENNKSKLEKSFKWSLTEIKSKKTNSIMRFNTSNAKSKDSKRTGCVLFDEEHAYKNWKTIKVFQSGGGKIQDYREFHASTDGDVRGGPLDDLKDEARMVLNREITDSTLFPFMCKLDNPEEADNEKMWEKSVPSYRYNRHLQRKMKDEYSLGKRRAEIRIEFMTKRMNTPMEDTRFEVASYEDRLATNQPIPDVIDDSEAIGGLDFADMRDFCSVGVLVKHGGKRYFIQHTFIHYKALELQNINPDIIRIALDNGSAEMVYDKTISPEKVVDWFVKMSKRFYIKKIAMDTMRATIIGPKLKEAGFEFEVIRKGPISHTRLSPLIDDMFINQTIVFGDDPLMRWFVGNVYVDYWENGNKEYKKKDKDNRKTDGFFAMVHALDFDNDLEDFSDYDVGNHTFTPIVV